MITGWPKPSLWWGNPDRGTFVLLKRLRHVHRCCSDVTASTVSYECCKLLAMASKNC